jgi:hypothetical protein
VKKQEIGGKIKKAINGIFIFEFLDKSLIRYIPIESGNKKAP